MRQLYRGVFGGEVENFKGFDAIPEGIYDCIIERAELKTSKAGKKYVSYSFKVVSPESKGRLIFDGLYWSSEGAVNVAKGKLASMGLTKEDRQVIDESNMVQAIMKVKEGKQYKVKVGVVDDESYGPKNVVKSFSIGNTDPFSKPTVNPFK
jgi:hypothetical protein